MARGKRTSLAALAGDVGDNSPVEEPDAGPARSAPLAQLTANPRNPREGLGDLADLASIADMQLQPAVVVTAGAYRALYPDDHISTRYVVINGCRRLAAAHKYGLSNLDIVVNDALARDRITLISAAITENVDRQDFDVIEEARAVEALVLECGRADLAGERLHRTEGWVSQRRALLKLAPELQTALRRGELAIREARSLARVPLEQQVARWRPEEARRPWFASRSCVFLSQAEWRGPVSRGKTRPIDRFAVPRNLHSNERIYGLRLRVLTACARNYCGQIAHSSTKRSGGIGDKGKAMPFKEVAGSNGIASKPARSNHRRQCVRINRNHCWSSCCICAESRRHGCCRLCCIAIEVKAAGAGNRACGEGNPGIVPRLSVVVLETAMPVSNPDALVT